MKLSESGGEDALITWFQGVDSTSSSLGERLRGVSPDLLLGIGDDTAVIDLGDRVMLVTTDMFVEGTHFRMSTTEPYLIGWKAAASSISDIAAMGGQPSFVFVSIGLPDIEVETARTILAGLKDAVEQSGARIAGGDTVTSRSGIVIDVVSIGFADVGMYAVRSGARLGDAIMVTGTLGDSAAGLALLEQYGPENARTVSEELVMRHLKPHPRIAEGVAALRTKLVTAMMDISDGLSVDLPRLCTVSGVGATVIDSDLPISAELLRVCEIEGWDPMMVAAAGGEDYELLITCAPESCLAISTAIMDIGCAVQVVGEVTPNTGAKLAASDGSVRGMPPGWSHFD